MASTPVSGPADPDHHPIRGQLVDRVLAKAQQLGAVTAEPGTLACLMQYGKDRRR
jgi:hypothetical protein